MSQVRQPPECCGHERRKHYEDVDRVRRCMAYPDCDCSDGKSEVYEKSRRREET